MYVAVCRRGAKTDIQWMGTVKWRKEPCFCLHGGRGFLVNLSLTSLVLLVLILVHDVAYHRVSYSHASRREVRVCFFWQLFRQCLPVCWVLLVVVIHSWAAQTLWMYFIMPWSSPFWLWRNLCLIITSVHSRRSQVWPHAHSCCVANPWQWFSSALEISTVAVQWVTRKGGMPAILVSLGKKHDLHMWKRLTAKAVAVPLLVGFPSFQVPSWWEFGRKDLRRRWRFSLSAFLYIALLSFSEDIRVDSLIWMKTIFIVFCLFVVNDNGREDLVPPWQAFSFL